MQTLTRPSAPSGVQFELTERCNNRCFFCYNKLGHTVGSELQTAEVKRILSEIAACGVLFCNLNGGEPVLRKDLVEIAAHGKTLGLKMHLNTNGTLLKAQLLRDLKPWLGSVCTSLLASTETEHDRMAGRHGAWRDVMGGMDLMSAVGIPFEVNVCTTAENIPMLFDMARIAAEHGAYGFCSTRYILTSREQLHLLAGRSHLVTLLEQLKRIKDEVKRITTLYIAGPIPFCEAPDQYRSLLKELNIPCQFAYGICRISPTGKMTPCTLSSVEIADLRKVAFEDAWRAAAWKPYEDLHHIPTACRGCDDLESCRAGCIMYDEEMIRAGVEVQTRKWNNILNYRNDESRRALQYAP